MTESRALTLASGSGNGGSIVVAPQSFGEVMIFADMMSKSSFVPRHLRGKPADCMAVTLQALRWAKDPFAVAQKTYFVQDGGPPGYEAQLINAVILSSCALDGRLNVEWAGSGGDLSCTVTGKFRGDPKPKVKTCRISTITTKNSPLWKSDPEQQLAYYTTRAWARLYAPDVIMGVYTPDEIVEVGSGVVDHGTGEVIAIEAPRSRLDALEESIGAGSDEERADVVPHPQPAPGEPGVRTPPAATLSVYNHADGSVYQTYKRTIGGAREFIRHLHGNYVELQTDPASLYAAHDLHAADIGAVLAINGLDAVTAGNAQSLIDLVKNTREIETQDKLRFAG